LEKPEKINEKYHQKIFNGLISLCLSSVCNIRILSQFFVNSIIIKYKQIKNSNNSINLINNVNNNDNTKTIISLNSLDFDNSLVISFNEFLVSSQNIKRFFEKFQVTYERFRELIFNSKSYFKII